MNVSEATSKMLICSLFPQLPLKVDQVWGMVKIQTLVFHFMQILKYLFGFIFCLFIFAKLITFDLTLLDEPGWISKCIICSLFHFHPLKVDARVWFICPKKNTATWLTLLISCWIPMNVSFKKKNKIPSMVHIFSWCPFKFWWTCRHILQCT